MSSYSDILEDLSEIKSDQQYVGFNPMSEKKSNETNLKWVMLLMLALIVSCFLMLSLYFLNSNEVHQLQVNLKNDGIEDVKINDKQENINPSISLKDEVLSAQKQIDSILENPAIELDLEKFQVNHVDFELPSKEPTNISIVKETVNSEEVELANKNKNESIFVAHTFKRNTVSTNDNISMDYLLSIIKSGQANKALELSDNLVGTKKFIIQAKAYEKIDAGKAIKLYQQLILLPNSPIEYVLKLGILNEQIGNNQQALYFYELYQRNNTNANQSIRRFVNGKVTSLKKGGRYAE